MTYYRGMGACCRGMGRAPMRRPGLHGLGIDESERIRRNAVAEQLARKWDSNALNYLRARSRYIPSFQVPAGAPYEPEGGVVSGWATATARTDAAQRHQNVVTFLAWSAPDPPNVPPVTTTPTAPSVPSGGHVPPPENGAQPLPEVTVLGAPDKGPPLGLLAAAAVLGVVLLNR